MTKDEVMGYIGLGLVAFGSFSLGYFIGGAVSDYSTCHVLDTSKRALIVANETINANTTIIKLKNDEINRLKARVLDMQEKKDI